MSFVELCAYRGVQVYTNRPVFVIKSAISHHVTGVSGSGQYGSENVDILNFLIYFYRLFLFI